MESTATLNPYATSAAGTLYTRIDHENDDVELASRERRFTNHLIDSITMNAFSFFFGVVYALADPGAAEGDFSSVGFVLGIIMFLTYYVGCEYCFGKTLGKLITGTHVECMDGSRPSFLRTLGRTAARNLPLNAISFLFSERGWHDQISGTRVVRSS